MTLQSDDPHESGNVKRRTFVNEMYIVLTVEPIDCVLSEWTSWSPCSLTCGMNGVRQRTRSVEVTSSGGGLPCGSRLEVILCEVLPC
jgi:hypothetical protein